MGIAENTNQIQSKKVTKTFNSALSNFKTKGNFLRGEKDKYITYKNVSTQPTADFSLETLEAQRELDDIFKAQKASKPAKPDHVSQQSLWADKS